MLVLSRKVGEKIIIGDGIEVTVTKILGGNKVQLGVSAPADCRIRRSELPAPATSEPALV
jgi:carbon storage regulator